ncbi:DNA repair protein RecO [Alteromonadaceae bacterium BrNp21-10]|nr:DNA repair protein RecO [Alteromonadaceae bacterium BrNp21-10]
MQPIELSAYILHKREYRETSYLVDAFSAEMGKVSFIAKGVRSSKHNLKSLLQPFQPLTLRLQGRHELKNLQDCEANGAALHLQDKALFSGLYLNELLNRLLQVDCAMEQVFSDYHHGLQQLSQQQAIEPILRLFEFSLLIELGYGLSFEQDMAHGENIDPQSFYQWQDDQGFVRMAGISQHKNCFVGAHLLAIAKEDWSTAVLASAKKISRLVLQPLLGRKPLKSRELFIQGVNL